MDLSPLTLSFIGTILGAAIALAGTYVTQRNLWQIEVLRDARALRDARRDRLRKLYESLLPFVYAAPGQKLRLREDPDPTYKQALGLALLEPDALEVVTLVKTEAHQSRSYPHA